MLVKGEVIMRKFDSLDVETFHSLSEIFNKYLLFNEYFDYISNQEEVKQVFEELHNEYKKWLADNASNIEFVFALPFTSNVQIAMTQQEREQYFKEMQNYPVNFDNPILQLSTVFPIRFAIDYLLYTYDYTDVDSKDIEFLESVKSLIPYPNFRNDDSKVTYVMLNNKSHGYAYIFDEQYFDENEKYYEYYDSKLRWIAVPEAIPTPDNPIQIDVLGELVYALQQEYITDIQHEGEKYILPVDSPNKSKEEEYVNGIEIHIYKNPNGAFAQLQLCTISTNNLFGIEIGKKYKSFALPLTFFQRVVSTVHTRFAQEIVEIAQSFLDTKEYMADSIHSQFDSLLQDIKGQNLQADTQGRKSEYRFKK